MGRSRRARRWVTVAAVLGAALLDCLSATAQTRDPQPADAPRFAVDVLVTPERGETPRHLAPAATAVIEAATIATLPVVQMSEIVSMLPGFQVDQEQTLSTRPLLSSRGFFGGGEAEYVLVIVDGVPAQDAESGLIDWSLLTSSS